VPKGSVESHHAATKYLYLANHSSISRSIELFDWRAGFLDAGLKEIIDEVYSSQRMYL